ncbi:ABC transporter substrate-binding protein [Microbacterium sp. 18062]|uniref:ABC transporter substrate-binding protein n=1 Tax=Microbacterium sp. 18062 TaxID=2681410 RepID=UPI00135B43C9|nr:ABC transporter substrate-binding protein [Microbacterium sp. 18062]
MSRVTAISKFVVTATAAVSLIALTGCASDDGDTPALSDSSSSTSAVNQEARALLPDEISDRGTLVVASSLSYPPFEYTTTDGVNEGFDIDLVAALSDALGLEVDLQKIPFEGQITGLTNSRFDLAMATFTITPERLEQVNFVQFLSAGTVVSVLKGSDVGIDGVSSLCGHTVGVQTGSAAEVQVQTLNDECVEGGESEIVVSTFPDQSSLVQAVLNGRVEARLDDSTTTAYINEQVDGQLEDIGEAYATSPTGFAIAKDNDGLLAATRVALQGLIDDGTYSQLAEEWGQSKNTVTEATVFTDPADVIAGS